MNNKELLETTDELYGESQSPSSLDTTPDVAELLLMVTDDRATALLRRILRSLRLFHKDYFVSSFLVSLS